MSLVTMSSTILPENILPVGLPTPVYCAIHISNGMHSYEGLTALIVGLLPPDIMRTCANGITGLLFPRVRTAPKARAMCYGEYRKKVCKGQNYPWVNCINRKFGRWPVNAVS